MTDMKPIKNIWLCDVEGCDQEFDIQIGDKKRCLHPSKFFEHSSAIHVDVLGGVVLLLGVLDTK